jgi:hypothetical protein
MAKPRFTHQQHTELGLHLAVMTDDLAQRITQIGGAYPRTGPGSAAYRELRKAKKAIDAARNAGEKALFNEHPDTDQFVYWPLSEDRAAYRKQLGA